MKHKWIRRGIGFSMILFMMGFHSLGWAQDHATNVEYNLFDLILARPLGVAVGVIGTGVFVLSLPFTIPTRSVDQAANLFIIDPFKFSFVREFPDEKL